MRDDWFDIIEDFFKLILGLVICFGICFVIFIVMWVFPNYIYNEYNFARLPVITQECELLSNNYSPSTQQTRVAPIIGANGSNSMAIYTTGDPETKTTVWMCGPYGRLTCDKKEVYQYAKDKSVLYIRSNDYDTRIIGIKHDEP